jgi:hypothetical protein
MLQNPDRPPGFHWIVQTSQGLGKDLMLRPLARAHGVDYWPVWPGTLTSTFNDYADKHLIGVSEMNDSGRSDVYTVLKAITSGAPEIVINPKNLKRYRAPNVAGFVLYTNELHPLRLAPDDRRFRVVENFGQRPQSPVFYRRMVDLLDQHWPMIAEYLINLEISADDLAMLRGDAAPSIAKTLMAEQVWQRAYLDIVSDIESIRPPPGYLPVALTTEIIKWLRVAEVPERDLPNRLDFPLQLYRLGARPLNPAHNNPAKANATIGGRLWRLARTWRDQQGVEWNLETMSPTRLAQFYLDRVMPPVDLKDINDEDIV